MLVGGQISSGGGHGHKVAIHNILAFCGTSHSAAPYPFIMAILGTDCESISPARGQILGLKSAVSAPMRAAKSVQMGDQN